LIGQGFAPGHARDFYEVLDSAEAVVARLSELPAIEQATAVSRL
jgi:hypothetical protein